MYYKTEPITREIVFDIYDNLDTEAAHEVIKNNFDKLDREEQKRIISGDSRLWLIRKSSEPGAITIESLQYNSNRVFSNDDSNKWIPQASIRLQLTENGWQNYAGREAPGLRAITKENISAPILQDLKDKLKKDPSLKSLEPQNMIYPEIIWATQDKKRKETPANATHAWHVKQVPNAEKGILRRDPTNSQSNDIYQAQRIEQKLEQTPQLSAMNNGLSPMSRPPYPQGIEKPPLETARDAPTITSESIVYSKGMTPNGIQGVLHSKLGSLDSKTRADLLAAGGSVWLIREGSEPDTLTVEALKYDKNKNQWEVQKPQHYTSTNRGWVKNPYTSDPDKAKTLRLLNEGSKTPITQENVDSLLDVLSKDGYLEEYRRDPAPKMPPTSTNLNLNTGTPMTEPTHASSIKSLGGKKEETEILRTNPSTSQSKNHYQAPITQEKPPPGVDTGVYASTSREPTHVSSIKSTGAGIFQQLEPVTNPYSSGKFNDFNNVQDYQGFKDYKSNAQGLHDLKEDKKEEIYSLTYEEMRNLTPEERCVKTFLKNYEKRLEKESFKFLRRSNLPENADLAQILAHAKKDDNRTRSICVALGWLKPNGELLDPSSNQVPECVVEAFNKKPKEQSVTMHQPG